MSKRIILKNVKDESVKSTTVPPERRLQVIGEINDEAYRKFSKKLYRLECDDAAPIIVELSSHGGDPISALAFAARIRLSPRKIVTIVYGQAASAAVVILASGHERLMTKEAWIMVHEDSSELNGEVKDLEREAAQLRAAEFQWNEILASRSKVSAEEWATYHSETTYFTAAEALKLGLVDRII